MPQNEEKKLISEILDCIASSFYRKTPVELVKNILNKSRFSTKDVKLAIKSLIAQGELEYTYVFGTSFIEKSFNRPVHIGDNIILKPSSIKIEKKADEIVIDMEHGVSFGTGRHPTTRLCLEGLEYLFRKSPVFKNDFSGSAALDMGTGSGVLAMAAALFGIEEVIGLDIDPCSVDEARKNVDLNGLANNIYIGFEEIVEIDKTFSLIIANLRVPTLKALYPEFVKKTGPASFMVLSGLKSSEIDGLMSIYAGHFIRVWTKDEKGWGAIVLHRP